MRSLILGVAILATAIAFTPSEARAWFCYVHEGAACRSSALGNMDSTCTNPCNVALEISRIHGIRQDQADTLFKVFGHNEKAINAAAKKLKVQP